MTQRKKQYHPKIPDYELEAIARCLLPDMQSYFESDEGKRAFAEWQAQQQNRVIIPNNSGGSMYHTYRRRFALHYFV